MSHHWVKRDDPHFLSHRLFSQHIHRKVALHDFFCLLWSTNAVSKSLVLKAEQRIKWLEKNFGIWGECGGGCEGGGRGGQLTHPENSACKHMEAAWVSRQTLRTTLVVTLVWLHCLCYLPPFSPLSAPLAPAPPAPPFCYKSVLNWNAFDWNKSISFILRWDHLHNKNVHRTSICWQLFCNSSRLRMTRIVPVVSRLRYSNEEA